MGTINNFGNVLLPAGSNTIDVQSLLTSAITAAQAPLTALQQQQTTVQNQTSALQSIADGCEQPGHGGQRAERHQRGGQCPDRHLLRLQPAHRQRRFHRAGRHAFHRGQLAGHDRFLLHQRGGFRHHGHRPPAASRSPWAAARPATVTVDSTRQHPQRPGGGHQQPESRA